MSYYRICRKEVFHNTMQKYEYRSYFADVKKYVKLTPLCHECNVSQSALSRFMMGDAYDYVISLESLDRLYNHLQKVLSIMTYTYVT